MHLQLKNHREQRQKSSWACWLQASLHVQREILYPRNSQQRQTRSPNILSFNLLSVAVINTVTKSNMEEERAFVTYGPMFILKGVRLETQARYWKQELKQKPQRNAASWLAYFQRDFRQLFFFLISFIYFSFLQQFPLLPFLPVLFSHHVTSCHITSLHLTSPHLCTPPQSTPTLFLFRKGKNSHVHQ